ncbi:unnamed protein product [Adineta steineri]|uniref:Uncharacterized protein n=1 Tax=Adineta steineri TaxID=433720 RepID=A0A818I054_9BILA|nr:unnamed protein product [Adineta steineri]CAF3517680.1 unnamed protein product [Adineta steineri]
MSDKQAPQRPKGPRMSHLYTEPIPMSFATPQQLASLASGATSLFPRMPMTTGNQAYMPMMNAGYNMNPGYNMHNPNSQIQPIQSVTNNTVATSTASAASTNSQAASSDKKTLKPLPPQEIDIDTFKGFKFVTLDDLQVETREIYDNISGTFRWEMCQGQEERCVSCIRDDCKNRRVFLVSSGSLGSRIVPLLHELPQLYAIYVYCADVERHSKWAKDFSKVRVVCNNDDKDLLPQFAVDVAQSNIDWGNALLKKGTHDKAKEKFELALKKLKDHAAEHDNAMDVEIETKIKECK